MPFALLRRPLPAMFVLGLLTAAVGPVKGAVPKVPDGFEARLVATVPAVQYPCQVATAPGHRLFVAEDPMDQIGPYEAFHGRILLFVNDQDPAVFAEGFRSIQGMAWRDDALYVCHMPFLTIVRDLDGDGKADQKTDLFHDLGPTANQGLNDHIVSGIQFGMDGYLYISVGDKGVPAATRPEDGAKVQLKGGGTLRCRPDGTGLEVYTYGTRNHLEPNLDDRDNLFTYDNTDDGDGWWTRVTHHVDGGYYGYPYDYHDRPDRHLPRMAEYGGGSPCGAVVYKEDAWPEPWRNVGLWAEWGKGKVHAFRFAPDGATFKVAETIDFAVPDGLSNFRPIDLAVSYDGTTLYVADWGMGGWGSKTEKVGRVYAITYKNPQETRPRGQDADPLDDQIKQLDHPSFNERTRAQLAIIKAGRDALGQVVAALTNTKTDPVARRHLIWALDGIAGASPEATFPLIDLLNDQIPDLRAQAARALGERRVPIALGPLTALLKDHEPTVRLQGVIALGRIGDPKAVPDLVPVLTDADPFIAFSARQALRRINDWSTAAKGLASPDPKGRLALLAAMEEQYEPEAVAALASYASDPDRPAEERARALAYLSEVHHKAKPWDGKWWGTRPTRGKPPARELDWDGTPIVLNTVRNLLDDDQAAVRIAAIQGVQDELDRDALPPLRDRFAVETDIDARRKLANAFGYFHDEAALPMLIAALRDPNTQEPIRDASLTAVGTIGGQLATRALVDLLEQRDLPNDRLPKIIKALGSIRSTEAIPSLLARLDSPDASVRASLVEALGQIGRTEGVSARVRPLIDDPDLTVRKAAIAAAAALKDREAVPPLMAA
ncbi:MAG: PVC-type heme-binding CxxCH protein, partial [Isosphaeraceae bacterium]